MNKEPLRSSCILLVLHICLLLITGFDVLYLLYMYSSIVLMSTPVLIILRYIFVCAIILRLRKCYVTILCWIL